MRVFFPKYLNRNKLLYKLEYDEWLVIAVSFFSIFYLFGFFLMFNIIISLVISYFATRSITKYYIGVHKEESPGYLYHYFYDMGFSKPKENKDDDKDIKFPFGFETEFKD